MPALKCILFTLLQIPQLKISRAAVATRVQYSGIIIFHTTPLPFSLILSFLKKVYHTECKKCRYANKIAYFAQIQSFLDSSTMSKGETELVEGRQKKISILIADDDEDDCMLAHEALIESHFQHELHVVKDGEELMDYLYRRGKYANPENASPPGLILLDLNMPKKDGREALKEIKSNPNFRHIPVVILTTSKAAEDIQLSYSLGANSFIIKPVTFASLVEVMKTIGKYWFDIVELPY